MRCPGNPARFSGRTFITAGCLSEKPERHHNIRFSASESQRPTEGGVIVDQEVVAAREHLNRSYDSFVARLGPIAATIQ